MELHFGFGQTIQKEEVRRDSQAFIPCSYGHDKQFAFEKS
jgi:hypothetical protein